jgi:hypothetical protein
MGYIQIKTPLHDCNTTILPKHNMIIDDVLLLTIIFVFEDCETTIRASFPQPHCLIF